MRHGPIALFAYNRPDHLRANLEKLSSDPCAIKSDLYVFSDGPKTPTEAPLVAAVREVAKSARGFRSVTLRERAGNAGLVAAVTEGVGELCREHGRVIVLEDDLLTAPGFLSFMNQALDKYQDQSEVMQISGYMYPVPTVSGGRAAFLPVTSCWGWATWQRAWDAYDPAMRGREQVIGDPIKRRAFNLDGAYDYASLLSEHLAGRVSSWGVVWHLSVFMRGGLTLYPPTSLVSNMGFDGSGTHGQPNSLGQVTLAETKADFVWPDRIATDPEVYEAVKQLIRSSKKGWKHWLKNLLTA